MTYHYQVLIPKLKIGCLDYYSSDKIAIGSYVCVPFRKKTILGIVWNNAPSTCPRDKIKEIIYICTYPGLTQHMMDFIEKVASYNMVSLNTVLKSVLPIDNLFEHKHHEYYTAEYHNKLLGHDITKPHNVTPLSDPQQEIATSIKQYINQNCNSTILLQGTTGSGKTELYLSILVDLLTENPEHQALILLPEISLSRQLLQRVYNIFSEDAICIWNSKVGAKQKRLNLMGIISGKIKVIIGARSAVFLPYQNLQYIIVDEEHDASYKQEEGFIYNGRDMSVLRAYYERVTAILVSATPSLETMYNYRQNKYKGVTIGSRFGSAGLPDIEIVDTRSLSVCRSISDQLKEQVSINLSHKKQVLLFLNRKGYSPVLMCKECKYRFICQNCSTGLVEYRSSGELVCHHCMYTIDTPQQCTQCQAADHSLLSYGMGSRTCT